MHILDYIYTKPKSLYSPLPDPYQHVRQFSIWIVTSKFWIRTKESKYILAATYSMHFALMKRPGLCASNYCDVERNTSSMTLEDLIKQDERKRKRTERERERAQRLWWKEKQSTWRVIHRREIQTEIRTIGEWEKERPKEGKKEILKEQ